MGQYGRTARSFPPCVCKIVSRMLVARAEVKRGACFCGRAVLTRGGYMEGCFKVGGANCRPRGAFRVLLLKGLQDGQSHESKGSV